MKTISIELNDDIADWLIRMDNQKRNSLLKILNTLEKETDWKKIFAKTAEQAAKQGLTEEQLNKLLKK